MIKGICASIDGWGIMGKFVKVCAIKLERDSEGRIANESPVPGKESCKGDLVPYCRFRVPSVPIGGGVFLIKIDGEVKSVGGTENLDRYFYGGCSRVCTGNAPYKQGWPAECRFKKGLHDQVKTGELVEVWFLRIDDETQRRRLKLQLMNKNLKSKWSTRW